jgi:hypothetical protein
MRIETDYLAATHTNELSALLVYMLLTDHPDSHHFFSDVSDKEETLIPGVESLIAHPAALIAGRGLLRYIGPNSSQLQDHYATLNPQDPQDQAAYYVLDCLGKHTYDRNAVVLDGHNNTTPDLRFARIGSLASRRTIAAANIVSGLTDFVIRDDSFSDEVLTGATLEESAPGGLPDHIEIAKRHYEGLHRLASKSPEALDDHYATIFNTLRFLRVIEIPTLKDDGNYAEYLPELERISIDRAFTPIDLPMNVRQQLNIEEDNSMVAIWGYEKNMSPIIDAYGRKLFFGSVFCEISPPVADGDIWIKQHSMARRRAVFNYDSPLTSAKSRQIFEENTSVLYRKLYLELDGILAEIIRNVL